MSADKKFLFFMIGFLVGLFVVEYLLVVVLLCVCGLFYKNRAVVFLLILGCLFGALRMFVSDIVLSDDVRNLNGKGVVEFTACISDEVDVRFDRVKYTVSDVTIDDDFYRGRVLVNAEKYPVFSYGDVVEIIGEIETPEPIEDFEYDKYLARYGIYSIVNSPSIRLIGECGNLFYKSIYRFKLFFEKRLFEIFPEPHGSLVDGLLLGSRKGIPAELMEDFNEIGLTHIVAISGYNITLVIVVIFGLFGFLSRKGRVVAASVFVCVFVVLVGASSAVVRAAIMGVLGLMALYFGRKTYVAISIVISAFLMNLWNPKIAVYDTGFQLSFLATLGLVYVSPKIESVGGFFGKFLGRVPVFFAVRENLIMTLSAQAFALPVILKSFGRFSLVCPLANIFILPFIPFVMLFSFLAIVLSFVSNLLGEIFAFICYVVLDLIFFLVRGFADLSRLLADFL